MASPPLDDATASVPPGAWAVGVSGGADSVALLLLLRRRPDLSLTVVHLNHEMRGTDSDGDEAFVVDLCASLGHGVVARRWRDVAPALTHLPNNPSARFRAARFALFREVVQRDSLRGVLLAHHADDVAETTFQRLLRGGGVRGLAVLRPRSTVGGLLVLRPLLRVRCDELRWFLTRQRQSWCEDASNASPRYQRNRVRSLLARHPDLTSTLLDLAEASAGVKDWLAWHAPRPRRGSPSRRCPTSPRRSRPKLRDAGWRRAGPRRPSSRRRCCNGWSTSAPTPPHHPGSISPAASWFVTGGGLFVEEGKREPGRWDLRFEISNLGFQVHGD